MSPRSPRKIKAVKAWACIDALGEIGTYGERDQNLAVFASVQRAADSCFDGERVQAVEIRPLPSPRKMKR